MVEGVRERKEEKKMGREIDDRRMERGRGEEKER